MGPGHDDGCVCACGGAEDQSAVGGPDGDSASIGRHRDAEEVARRTLRRGRGVGIAEEDLPLAAQPSSPPPASEGCVEGGVERQARGEPFPCGADVADAEVVEAALELERRIDAPHRFAFPGRGRRLDRPAPQSDAAGQRRQERDGRGHHHGWPMNRIPTGPLPGGERPGLRRHAEEEAREIRGDLAATGVALPRIALQAFAADREEIKGHASDGPIDRLRLAQQDPPHRLGVGVSHPPAGADEEPVKQEAEGVDVGGRADRADRPVDLLGGHPGRGAERGPDAREAGKGIGRSLGIELPQAEVAEFHIPS